MCDKPAAREIWLFDELKDHWESLVLRSWTINHGARRLYQEGPVSAMLHPRDLIAGYAGDGRTLDEGTAMFSSTLAAIGGIQSAGRFEFELDDPLLDRRLTHGYDVRVLPLAG